MGLDERGTTQTGTWERGEPRIRDAHDLLRGVVAALPASVTVLSEHGEILLLPQPDGQELEPTGRSYLDRVPEPLHGRYRSELGRALCGETVTFDTQHADEHGEPQWVRVSFAPLRLSGQVVAVVAMETNIERERSMQQREQRIRTMFDHSSDGMLVVSIGHSTVLECNEAAAKLLAIPAQELLGTVPSWLQLTPEGGVRLGWGALLDELTEGRAIRGRAILRDGYEVSVELRASLKTIDGQECAFVLCHDIGADLAAERAKATQERLATVGSLAAGVAHEINNPLAYVIANVQYALDTIHPLTQRDPDPGDERERELRRAQIKEALYEANEGARRVQRIVADLKTLARQGEDRLEPIDVENTLHWAIGVTMPEIRHRATLIKRFDYMPAVRGDEARLGQVFVNLLLNAAQAIDPDDPSDNEVTVNTFTRSGRVIVEVLDSGSGIPEENLTKIFDPFFTTKPRGVGTGLGLSICHEIVAAMRGSLTAENRSAGGAKFVVDLPAMEESTGVSVRPTPPPPPATYRNVRIMIIDDEPLAAKALARILREHKVEVADHAPTGLKKVLTNDYDVIFCDLMMPEMSGMAVHKAVVSEQPDTAERMVFVTGGTFTEEARSFASEHGARCLYKPFDIELVKRAVARIVEQRASAQKTC